MEVLEEDICKVFKRRAYDMAASVKGVKVFLNGEKLSVRINHQYYQFQLLEEYSMLHVF